MKKVLTGIFTRLANSLRIIGGFVYCIISDPNAIHLRLIIALVVDVLVLSVLITYLVKLWG